MEAKEILARLKEAFNDLVAPAPVLPAAPVAAMATDYELAGGGTVQIDVLEVGGIVMIDGNTALPGDLELADGTKLTVGDNGVISAVEPGMVAPVVAPVEDMGAKFSAFETLANEKFSSYETKFSAYEQRFADYEVKMKKANKVIEQLLQLSQLIVEAPIVPADPSVRPINTFKEEEKKYSSILFN